MFKWLRSGSTVRSLVLLGLLASIFSFAKFEHCRAANWAAPDSYVHACYSDIPILFSARGLDHHQWSFSGGTHAVEYPVITGAVMWITSLISPADSPSVGKYFDLNVALLALLFIFSILLVWRMRPEYAYLLPLSPAMLAALYINWDLWGIVTMLLAINLFDRRKYFFSSVMLAVSIATKFFPVFLFLPILIILWRKEKSLTIIKYMLTAMGTWLVINLPVMIATPQGWWHFYALNLKRSSDWGSIWYALSLLGVNIQHVNFLTLLALLLVLTAMTVFLLELENPPSLAQVSFILLGTVLCIGKVYSPQYVLWLVPLALIAISTSSQLRAFWIWQAGELIYHVAIWEHLALVSGTHFGLSETGYAIATSVRVVTCLYFVAVLVRRALQAPSEEAHMRRGLLADFLFGATSSYP